MRHSTMYRLGDLIFELESSQIPVPENFRQFQVTEGEPSYRYELYPVDALRWDTDDFQVHKDQICIAIDGGLETRYLCVPGSDHPYAVSRELDSRRTLVSVDRHDLELLKFDNIFCSLLSPERRMFHRGAFVLHSACTLYRDEVILFTAPSGVGKSTQAALWEQYRGAQVLNGDRTLLQFRDGQLYACGWPVCGSSGICRNETHPVRAIVLLEQAQENTVTRLNDREYTLRLMREITINYHDPRFFDGALDFISQLIARTDLRLLRCEISPRAVDRLHSALYGEETP